MIGTNTATNPDICDSDLGILWDNCPLEYKKPKIWGVWRAVHDGNNKIKKVPWRADGLGPLKWQSPLNWLTFEEAKALYLAGLNLPEHNGKNFSGVGFFVPERTEGESGPAPEDLDNSVEGGQVKTEAKAILDRIFSYSELSPSRRGIHILPMADLPKDFTNIGRIDNQPLFLNGQAIEIFTHMHFVTFTGWKLEGYPSEAMERSEEVKMLYLELVAIRDANRNPKPAREGTPISATTTADYETRARRYVERALDDEAHKVETAKRPTDNSPGARNSTLNTAALKIGHYAPRWISPDDIERVLLRAAMAKGLDESGARATIRSGLKKGMSEPRDPELDDTPLPGRDSAGAETSRGPKETLEQDDTPEIYHISLEDPVNTVGLAEDGTVKKVVEITDSETGKRSRFLSWVSDCPLYISTETTASDSTEFTFRGVGARDKRQVCFTMPAPALAESKKFKGALLNAFGARNKIGHLTFEMVQEMTTGTRMKKRIEAPTWDGNIPLLPGVDLAEDVEYQFSSYTPANVHDGDLDIIKECLRAMLGAHRYAPIVVTTVLGAPAFARWHINDRFGLGMWGTTGTYKTSFAQVGMGMWGHGYLEESALLKFGKVGSTPVGSLEIFASAGILPQILDNVKAVDPKDILTYVSTIHAILEGKDKARGKKDGGLRESREFKSTPLITGEVRPSEASTTARVLNLPWNVPVDLAKLSFLQAHAENLPIIGYNWLKFLSETELNLVDGFDEARGCKAAEFSIKHYVNPGRLATIYTLLKYTFRLLCESPLGDVFREFTKAFDEALKEAVEIQGATVTEETELERFLRGVRELIASDPQLIQGEDVTKTILGKAVVGKWTPKGIFLLPDKVLKELERIGVFTQKPTEDSMTKALNAVGYLIPGEDGHLKAKVRMNGTRPRGWLLKPEVVPTTGDAEKDNSGSNGPDCPGGPSENERENSDEILGEKEITPEIQKDNQGNGGATGTTGATIDNTKVTDTDLPILEDGPTNGPTNKTSGDTPLGWDQNSQNGDGDAPRTGKRVMPTPAQKGSEAKAKEKAPSERATLQMAVKETAARWEKEGRPIELFVFADVLPVKSPDLASVSVILMGAGYRETDERGPKGFPVWRRQ